MKISIKSLLIATALVAPVRQIAAFAPAGCDQVVRMAFGSILGFGLYKTLEDGACNLWGCKDSSSASFCIDYQSEQKSILRSALKLAKNIGKTAVVLGLGYALVYNSFADLFLRSQYQLMEADLGAQCFKTNQYKNDSWWINQNGLVRAIPHNVNVIQPLSNLSVAVS